MTEAAAAGEPARSAPLRHDAGGKSDDGDQRSSLNSPSLCRQAQRKVGHLFDGKHSIMTGSFPSKVLYKKSAKCAILNFISGLSKFRGA
jgi:hypothetical protein